MPFIKRAVKPSSLCRQAIPSNITNELECITNNALSNVILQLSSLSMHAEDTFGELFNEANLFYTKVNNLQERIDRLAQKATRLDSSVEEVSLHNINKRKAFKSSVKIDQQVVSRELLLDVTKKVYDAADKPPPLQYLNPFRDDGKDALKIYTDPDYFFNLWREAMTKEVRDAKEKRREQRRRDRKSEKNPNYRQERKVKAAIPNKRIRAKNQELGEEFAGSKMNSKLRNQSGESTRRAVSNLSTPSSSSLRRNHDPRSSHVAKSSENRGENLNHPIISDISIQGPICYEPPPQYCDLPEPPPPPPVPYYEHSLDFQLSSEKSPSPPRSPASPSVAHYRPMTPPTALPPPPLPPDDKQLPPLSPPHPPPPPPAPPEPSVFEDDDASSPPGYQNEMARQLASVQLKKVEKNSEPTLDSRSELLQAIRVGYSLKKVEKHEKSSASFIAGNDVASILARRIAFIDDDSESDSYYSDDSDWES